jgi:hypothetical protein
VKFLLDHDVPNDLTYLLEELGHEVTLVRKVIPEDSSDVVIRRRTRAAERAALFRLLERAGETGIQNNVNFS